VNEREVRRLLSDPETRRCFETVTGLRPMTLDGIVSCYGSGDGGASASSRPVARQGGGGARTSSGSAPSPPSPDDAEERAYRAYVEATGGPAPSLETGAAREEEVARLRGEAAWAEGSEREWEWWAPWL